LILAGWHLSRGKLNTHPIMNKKHLLVLIIDLDKGNAKLLDKLNYLYIAKIKEQSFDSITDAVEARQEEELNEN
jgi:hypothetical protein